MALAHEVQDAGQEVAAANGATLADVLNCAIRRFLSWPYSTASGCVVDRHGTNTEAFASVVYAVLQGGAAPDPGPIPADTVAAVIDATESMDLDSFRGAYSRIAQAKRPKKTPGPRLKGTPSTTVTLGIIFAQRSALPLEDFAEELERLNTLTPSREWPDMVVVADVPHVACESRRLLPGARGAAETRRRRPARASACARPIPITPASSLANP